MNISGWIQYIPRWKSPISITLKRFELQLVSMLFFEQKHLQLLNLKVKHLPLPQSWDSARSILDPRLQLRDGIEVEKMYETLRGWQVTRQLHSETNGFYKLRLTRVVIERASSSMIGAILLSRLMIYIVRASESTLVMQLFVISLHL